MAESFEIGTGHVTITTNYDGRAVRRVSARAGTQAGKSFMTAFFGYGQMGRNRRFRKMLDQFFRPLERMQSMLSKVRRPALFTGIMASILALIPTVTQLTSVVGAGAVPATLAWYSTVFMLRGMLGNLSKTIKSQTLKALNDASEKFKELARESAKPGLNAFLQEAIKHTPILNKYIRELGRGMSDTGFAMRDMLRRGENIQKIRFTLDQTAQATRIWYNLLDEASEVLITIAAAGAPLFLRFTNQMERVAHTIHDWILLKYETGEMTRYLNEAYRTLEKMGRGGRDFLIGLFNIINGGVFGAERVADNFERWGASFREWTTHQENIDKIRDTIKWFTDHIAHFFRLAAAATAVGLALKSIGAAQGFIMTLRTMLTLGPLAFILFGIGSAIASMAGGFVLAFTQSEKFRRKASEIWNMLKTQLWPIFKDWGTWIQKDLLPLLEELAIQGIEKLGGALGSLIQTIKDNQEGLKELRPIITWLIGVFSRLTGFVLVALIEELEGVITVLGWVGRAFKTGKDAVAEFNDWVDRVVKNVSEWFGQMVEDVRTDFNNFKRWAGDAVDTVARFFRELPGKIVDSLKKLPGNLAKLGASALDGLIIAIGFGLGNLYDLFVGMPKEIGRWLTRTWKRGEEITAIGLANLVSFVQGLPNRVISAIVDLAPKVGDFFARVWKSVRTTTGRWFDNVVKFVGDLPDRVINALLDLGPKTKKQTDSTWKGVRTTTASWFVKIVSFIAGLPDRAWKALVRFKNRMVDRFATGWAAATGTSKTKVAGIINFILAIPGRAWNALRALAGRLADRARTGWASFQKALGDKVASTIAYVVQIPGRIHRGLGNMAALLKQKGKDTIQGLWDGMTSVWNRVMAWIRGIPAWIRRNKGPLDFDRRLLIPAGKAIMEGLGTGLLFGAKGPFGFLKGIAGTIKSLLNLDPMALLGDLAGGGGGGSSAGLVGFARLAWDIFGKAFGLTMGGWRATGSVPGSDHPKGKAIDIMTTNSLLHRLIIELGKRLPGAKYWISMRQIASAPDWRPRPYSGPSPHTDHVHWSFFRQGGRLPENIFGFGKSGRGYMLHKGEDVIRRNQTTYNNTDRGVVINGGVHLHVDPRTIRDIDDVIDLVKNLPSSARQMGVRPRVA